MTLRNFFALFCISLSLAYVQIAVCADQPVPLKCGRLMKAAGKWTVVTVAGVVGTYLASDILQPYLPVISAKVKHLAGLDVVPPVSP